MRKINETLKSRKFWATVILIAISVTLFVAGQIDVDRMIIIIQWACGIYVGGLSVEDAAKKLAAYLGDLVK